MNQEWQKDLEIRKPSAAAFLPPETVDETGWDILLALHTDQRCGLSFEKLAAIVSTPRSVIKEWLIALKHRQLITGAKHTRTGDSRAVLTPGGRDLLDRYLSAISGLQLGIL